MTETNGSQILSGLGETRKFFEQVSLLIRTAEDTLRDEGWETLFGNKCTDITGHLYKPANWMPTKIYRFFVSDEDNENNKDKLLFVGVLLDSAENWGGFREPWVTCGLYWFKPDFDVRKFIHWGWVSEHLDCEQDPDGLFHDYELTTEDQEEYNLVYETTMALPIVDIDSAQVLKEKIIEPLLTKFAEVAGDAGL